ncbi:30S ribosomal protein S17 [Candidatus Saccharibacteria bacterium]|nr:30S ribosomal protein S17 [Candidatus Saccharibacteria bacterium]
MARTLTGVVSSDKRDKTITVTVTSRETHPLYRKQVTATRRYSAHDEKNLANVGDTVLIAETRPVSKTKNWELVEIIEKSHGKVELKNDTNAIIDDATQDTQSTEASIAKEEVK